MLSWEVIVVGAGAAGLLAAARAAERGRRVLLLEKNARAGIKILMSGGTRCNLTQNTDSRGIIAAYGKPGRFLHSALAALGPHELVALVEQEGVPTKVEETGKIFPVSNDAADVLGAFLRRLDRSGASLALGEPVLDIQRRGTCFGVTTKQRIFEAGKLIVTTGGKSYPGSGTTGDGYGWAAACGHTIVPPRPALVPITTHVDWVKPLRGITIPDVELSVWQRESGDRLREKKAKPLAQRRGSLLFAHFGLSGPVVLDVSRVVSAAERPQELELVCDFLPATADSQLEQELVQLCRAEGKKQMANVLARWLPERLVTALCAQAGLPVGLRAADVSRAQRTAILSALKHQSIPIAGTMGFRKAEVTAGGVSLDEVDSSTMQSKLVPNLYFAGEILDLDGPIGGYNFQAAFSTGWLAGESV